MVAATGGGDADGRVLEGRLVVDASTNLAGPLAAMVLGDLGAAVVKVERPPHGDDTRLLPPQVEGLSPVFLSVNRGKRSVVLDLRDPDALDAYLRLVERADVVIDSFGPGVAERLGVDFSDLEAVNGRVVHCSVSAFGSGPIGSAMPGYDALIQAFTGMMAMTGEPGGPPTRVAPSAIDLSTGLWAVINIMAALHGGGPGGGAVHIEAALVDSAFAMMSHQVLETVMTGAAPARQGSAARSAAPNEAFRTADGWVMIATANDGQFTRLCDALDLPEVAVDPRFTSIGDRVAARPVLHAALAARVGRMSTGEVLDRLGAARVPSGPIHTLDEALGSPLAEEREVLRPAAAEAGAPGVPQVRLPLRGITGSNRPPPATGAHTAEVLVELGCPQGVVRRLSGRLTDQGP